MRSAPLEGTMSAVTYWPSGLSPRARREPLFSHCASERTEVQDAAVCQLCRARQRGLETVCDPKLIVIAGSPR